MREGGPLSSQKRGFFLLTHTSVKNDNSVISAMYGEKYTRRYLSIYKYLDTGKFIMIKLKWEICISEEGNDTHLGSIIDPEFLIAPMERCICYKDQNITLDDINFNKIASFILYGFEIYLRTARHFIYNKLYWYCAVYEEINFDKAERAIKNKKKYLGGEKYLFKQKLFAVKYKKNNLFDIKISFTS